ncbi:hypothetical protein J2T57_000455 [Natronocella acetinitrilica]|uniref:Uncharacterized protein n=1 Tax=Natronocella acetinitrilica TaxID=414046 RepID=A0AAE3G2R3_9GAMM|nr:hypothetical protein [Natronocella acetinitrilica]MCP1673363.1 hypothetical protein [Natronocella acetinitrilica]
MNRLILDSTSTAQWHRLVKEAQAACDTRLDEHGESYLVFLLMRYLRNRELLRRAMGVGYLHALQTSGRLQGERLRDVGDQCLMLSGLFPGQAVRRRVRSDYFVALGRSAYDEAQRTAPPALGDLYASLAEHFIELRDVLQAMRADPDDNATSLDKALRRMERTAAAEPGTGLTKGGRIPGQDSGQFRH